ncbi:hypothetical protein EI94DRAFT_1810038 [Lactarius quietus]|nr:hypothetical protein EI94DRAFT_1810038 [Lactarius quietus]
MSAPQPNPPNQPSGHLPSAMPVPTTPLGMVQTAFSLLSAPAGSQSAPSPHGVAASSQEIAPDAYVPTSAPAHAPTPSPPVHATQIAADIAFPALAASISSHGGRPPTPPRGPRVIRTSSALPELAYYQPPARPLPLPGSAGLRRSTGTAHDEDLESFEQPRDVEDQYDYFFKWFKTKKVSVIKPKPYPRDTVGARLQPTVDEAKKECEKAEWTAQFTTWALHIATGLQVLIGALTTALGAALSGKHTSVAISTLGGASTLVASYLARSRSTNEPETSRNRAAALKHFLREIRAYQLDYGTKKGTEFDNDIRDFRQGLERMLYEQSASAAMKPEEAGQSSGEKGAGAMKSKPGFTGAGTFTSSPPKAKLDYRDSA